MTKKQYKDYVTEDSKKDKVRIWNPLSDSAHKGSISMRFTAHLGGNPPEDRNEANSFLKTTTNDPDLCPISDSSQIIHNENIVETFISFNKQKFPEIYDNWAIKGREYLGAYQINESTCLFFNNLRTKFETLSTLESLLGVKIPNFENEDKEIFAHEVHSNNIAPLSLKEIVNISYDISEQLEIYHNMGGDGIIHFDLNPGNMLLVGKIGQRRCIVNDFGISRQKNKSVKELFNKASAENIKNKYYAKDDIIANSIYSPPDLKQYGQALPEIDTYCTANLVCLMFTGRLVEHFYNNHNISENDRNFANSRSFNDEVEKEKKDNLETKLKSIKVDITEQAYDRFKGESKDVKDYDSLIGNLVDLIFEGTAINRKSRFKNSKNITDRLTKIEEEFNLRIDMVEYVHSSEKKSEYKSILNETDFEDILGPLGLYYSDVDKKSDLITDNNYDSDSVLLDSFGLAFNINAKKTYDPLVKPNINLIIEKQEQIVTKPLVNKSGFSLNGFKREAAYASLGVLGFLMVGAGAIGIYAIGKHTIKNYISPFISDVSSDIQEYYGDYKERHSSGTIPITVEISKISVCGSEYVKDDFVPPTNWSEYECRQDKSRKGGFCKNLNNYTTPELIEQNNLQVCEEHTYCCPPKENSESIPRRGGLQTSSPSSGIKKKSIGQK